MMTLRFIPKVSKNELENSRRQDQKPITLHLATNQDVVGGDIFEMLSKGELGRVEIKIGKRVAAVEVEE